MTPAALGAVAPRWTCPGADFLHAGGERVCRPSSAARDQAVRPARRGPARLGNSARFPSSSCWRSRPRWRLEKATTCTLGRRRSLPTLSISGFRRSADSVLHVGDVQRRLGREQLGRPGRRGSSNGTRGARPGLAPRSRTSPDGVARGLFLVACALAAFSAALAFSRRCSRSAAPAPVLITLDVGQRVDLPAAWITSSSLEAAHHVDDRVDLADVARNLLPGPRPSRRP